MQKKLNKELELELSECDIEIQKYHMSMIMSLLMPFILTFASIGIATDDTTLKTFFIGLSMVLLFILAGLIYFDSSKLKTKYRQRKNLILGKHGQT